LLTIAVINQKGGSGKTTTATNLAAVWGRERAVRTLLVDLDPQFAATRHLGYRPADLPATLHDVLADGVDTSTAIRNASDPGVDLIGGDRRLAELELSLVGEAMRERFLITALETVAEQYDFCVSTALRTSACSPSTRLSQPIAYSSRSGWKTKAHCRA